MSWYADPHLFIASPRYDAYVVYRLSDECINRVGGPSEVSVGIDIIGDLNFSKHLSLDNKEDIDAFKASFPNPRVIKLVNSRGVQVTWDPYTRLAIVAREDPHSPFWNIPGTVKPKSLADQQALEEKVSELEARISCLQSEINRNKLEKEALEAENASLKDQVNKDRDDKVLSNLDALEKQVSDLTSKFSQCYSAMAEPWMKLEKKNSDLEVKISSLQDEVNNNKVEKEAIGEKVSDLEVKFSSLQDEVNRQRDRKILASLQREEIHAGLKALDKQVSDLTSKLV